MAEEKYCNEVPLKAGVREFLEELRNRNIRIGISSSNSRELNSGSFKSPWNCRIF